MMKNNPTLLTQMIDILMQKIKNVKDVTDILPVFVIQLRTLSVISHFGKNKEDTLGITDVDGPLIRTYPHLYASQKRQGNEGKLT